MVRVVVRQGFYCIYSFFLKGQHFLYFYIIVINFFIHKICYSAAITLQIASEKVTHILK